MFVNSLDKKTKYVTDDGYECYDLSEGIIDSNRKQPSLINIKKVPPMFEMRPDLISNSLYGTPDYAELVIKYSMINNPFAIEKDDIIACISLSSINNQLRETEIDRPNTFDAVKNYHKYIDKSKVPSKNGSDSMDIEISTKKDSDNIEPNMSKNGNNGIIIKNGKVYFGAALDEKLKVNIDETTTAPDANLTLPCCADNGISLGTFLTKALKNT